MKAGFSILKRAKLKRQGVREMEEQNNSNSQLSTKSPWLSRDKKQPDFHSQNAVYLSCEDVGSVAVRCCCCLELKVCDDCVESWF